MDINKLQGIIPRKIINELPAVIKKYNINTKERLAHFLAQCYVESGNFVAVTENMNYSAKGLLAIFPKYFNINNVAQYERKPEKIGNKVYANRMGNGDVSSGDGYKFRGRSYIQLTGKANYQLFSKYMGIDFIKNPELVATDYALLCAGYFFERNKLWALCDKKYANVNDAVRTITRKVNGGTIHLDKRIDAYNKIIKALG